MRRSPANVRCKRCSVTDWSLTQRSRCGPCWPDAAGIHNSVRRRFGKIERRTARRIFLTCFGALTRVRCAAFFPLRRAFLSNLGASSKNKIHNAHFRIRTAQPTSTTAYLASRAFSASSQAVPTERTHPWRSRLPSVRLVNAAATLIGDLGRARGQLVQCAESPPHIASSRQKVRPIGSIKDVGACSP